MKKRNFSIGQKLKRAKTAEAKKVTAIEWVQNWQQEHEKLVQMLERSIQTNDYDLVCRATGQLKAVGKKRFDALPRVLEQLTTNPDEKKGADNNGNQKSL
ncbi:hypothetical protein [Shouchella clausii]|uniref:hypothetical protein n=1 Tax=Shouchella clausii TaxID=79880 RepID=UPI001C73935C|nr:hypothetical protein [Shouchella clausii]MBX0320340.1 hypothetical protein [Shouchella clausii]MEB5480896.1 hypothetical protein [Shouchella clausii]